MPIIVQQDATMYSLFISVNGCTRFGWYLHPSSGAHVTVATASGISETVTATCNLSWTWLEGNYSCSCGFTNANDDGWRYHPKHVERFTDINKLYIVASFWTIIGIYFTMHGPLNVKLSEIILKIRDEVAPQCTSMPAWFETCHNNIHIYIYIYIYI